MLNVVMLSVTYKPFMLSVIMLSIVMLMVVMLNAVMLSVIMLNVVMLSVVVLRVIMLNVVMLNVVMLSVGAQNKSVLCQIRKHSFLQNPILRKILYYQDNLDCQFFNLKKRVSLFRSSTSLRQFVRELTRESLLKGKDQYS
jgi:hypothetical protein